MTARGLAAGAEREREVVGAKTLGSGSRARTALRDLVVGAVAVTGAGTGAGAVATRPWLLDRVRRIQIEVLMKQRERGKGGR